MNMSLLLTIHKTRESLERCLVQSYEDLRDLGLSSKSARLVVMAETKALISQLKKAAERQLKKLEE